MISQKDYLKYVFGIEVVKIDNRYYALDGYNGENYLDCWETDAAGFEFDNETYKVHPIYDNEQNTILKYEIIL